jgi:putative Ca2+/H+ antiporter (TMEM165/GDT1 family)
MPVAIAYSSTFTPNVIAGLLLTLLGAVLALALTVCWSWAEDRAHGGLPPPAIRKLSAVAFALFTIGIFWQLIGYLRMEWTGW